MNLILTPLTATPALPFSGAGFLMSCATVVVVVVVDVSPQTPEDYPEERLRTGW